MRLTTLQGHYQCIVIDPPWFYRLRSKDKTHRNRIPYQPMRTEEILALPIPELCGSNGCILWLWFTNNHMVEAAQCLQTWGFELKTILTWEKVTKDNTKTHLGVGHWLRNSTEHCALAVRGNVKAFAGRTLTNQSSILHSPRREHSRKPEQFFELVEKLCPDITKLEMFARSSRIGWDCWGDEALKFDQPVEERDGDTSLSA
ncbi:adenine-specific DNA methyltransferase [Nostoc sp. UCD121]|uniref:MT-A70 family methyltransferase n=1 Tax=unclassified Nostoc TaxID=2593658 RepID=UPI0016258000|nr:MULTISPECIES: MT-A70 family methyltransferase [unclassified Nostoc]MBC1224521.1 adenine-specific DNA methyltransferase [Nostoc sp. UCD120]MBC1279335.1 adenine-specific DNA methyltransferase [Nostoc sp. UCD121]MBC1299975.1 adenine-specific DNA methyltransferase [Nostoc sp. UCD122]